LVALNFCTFAVFGYFRENKLRNFIEISDSVDVLLRKNIGILKIDLVEKLDIYNIKTFNNSTNN